MTNPEDQNKKQNNTIKDEAEKSLNQQNNQLDNTAFNGSETTNRLNENINKYQQTNTEIIEKNIDTTSKYQQDTFNTVQSITTNFVELQKNLLDTYQSVISRFLGDASESYLNNTTSPQRYTDIYNKTNQTITENTINATNRINDAVLGSTETFNNSIELTQKYYSDISKNYF